MVTTTPIPSFDAYYGLSQVSTPNGGSNNNTTIIIVLVAGVIVSAAFAYYAITENRRLNQMISDLKSKRHEAI